ncbi:MAG: FAD-dependent oxidoreductase, partial [Proteobacteria bacterium]|nr:FAD-dependent oxidoreductase [Pseudomonadota bacterium]
MTRHATVIGGGIVGICCALYLQREGFAVRVVEKGEPGRGATFGNAGSFGTASCVPFSLPGVLKRVPKMLFDQQSPLKMRWTHLPKALPWFVRFVAAARPERVEAIAAARNALLVHTHSAYAPLIEGAGAQDWVRPDGLLLTFESEAAFAAASYALELRRRNGVHMDILDGNEARQMEPALSPNVVRAVSLPDVARAYDPWRLCDALARDFVRRGGEIVRAEKDLEFERDSATDDTRVKTAVSWLEEAKLLTREENRVQVFPSSLRVQRLEEAETILAAADITGTRRQQLLDIVRHLMNAPPDQGISTDELTGVSGLTGGGLNKALSDLEALGIARNDVVVTVFIHVGVEGQSSQRLGQASRLEEALIALMREAAPDIEGDEASPLHLAETCQALRDRDHASARPDIVEKLLRGIAGDGRDQDGGRGNIRLRKASRNTLMVALQRSWPVLEQTAAIRRQAAELLLAHLVGKLSKGTRGKDLQVETTMGDLLASLSGDAFLRGAVQDMNKLMERALLWLHEQEVVTLGKGLTVFRPAMTVHLRPGSGGFTQKDFTPLDEHYGEQTIQTHVMAAYAEKGLEAMDQAQRLSEDYFVLDRDAFLRRWLPGRGTEIRRQTTGTSWRTIVDALDNLVQAEIVRDDREQTNVLVLAGPGSGKTRVLVHRIAYLVRVKREDPRGILVLTYNRHAAAEIRERLRRLIGDDAAGVTVSTCHALAMRLMGASFAGDHEGPRDFDGIVMQAVALLRGDGLTKVEAEALRETLIQGYRWLLVDEYQDIGPEEYALIGAVAGRSLEDDLRISLFAVGDDDQNIYAFAGASIDFIRRFEADYSAKPVWLTENYRSTAHIIAAANAVIAPAAQRMKAGHDITVNRARAKVMSGGA